MSVVYGRVIFTQLTMEFYLISSGSDTNKIIVIMRRAQNYRFSSNNNNNNIN